MNTPSAHSGPRCRHCGSPRLRRSRAHTSLERLVRRITPIHFHRCGECHRRGWHWPGPQEEAHGPGVTHRPVELRDVRSRIRNRNRVGRRVLIAVILGGAFAFAIRSCAERPRPTSSTALQFPVRQPGVAAQAESVRAVGMRAHYHAGGET